MILLDTNVLLDIATADPAWLPWSEKEFRAAATQGPILINPIIYAELAPAWIDGSIRRFSNDCLCLTGRVGLRRKRF
jgi:predicted nucleic acid-binding protein